MNLTSFLVFCANDFTDTTFRFIFRETSVTDLVSPLSKTFRVGETESTSHLSPSPFFALARDTFTNTISIIPRGTLHSYNPSNGSIDFCSTTGVMTNLNLFGPTSTLLLKQYPSLIVAVYPFLIRVLWTIALDTACFVIPK